MLKLVWNLKLPQLAIVILQKLEDSHFLTKLTAKYSYPKLHNISVRYNKEPRSASSRLAEFSGKGSNGFDKEGSEKRVQPAKCLPLSLTNCV